MLGRGQVQAPNHSRRTKHLHGFARTAGRTHHFPPAPLHSVPSSQAAIPLHCVPTVANCRDRQRQRCEGKARLRKGREAGFVCPVAPLPTSLPLRSSGAESDKWLSRWRDEAGKVGSAFSSPVFLPRVSFCRPHGVAGNTSPPARGFPLKTTPTGEGWRLRFFVTGDRPNTHSRAEKKRL